MKRIGFVILTWNSEKCIENCLESIFQLNSSEYDVRVVLVDNGSKDRTLDRIEQTSRKAGEHIKFHTIMLEKNYGTTYSRNLGIKYLQKENVRPDYLCILDSDTIVNNLAISEMIQVLDLDKSCGIVGPRMHDQYMIYQRSGRQIPTLTEKLMKVLPIKSLQESGISRESIITEEGEGCVEVGYLMSACWMIRTEIFERIGLLDEKIFYAPEDAEFCIRSWKNGFSVKYCYDANIIHEWQRLSRKKLFSKHNYEHIKGLVYMFWKHKYVFNADKFITIGHKKKGERQNEY